MRTFMARYGWAAVAFVVLLVHAPSLEGVFHYDDDHSIVRNTSIRELSRIPSYFVDPDLFSADPGRGMFRPVLLTSYAINRALLGATAGGFLVVNLLIHAANAALVALIARHWLTMTSGVAAGLLFGLHPLSTEPVNYASARSDSLVAFFVLLTIQLALHRGHGLHFRARSTAAAALALLTKSTAIVTAPLLMVVDWLEKGAGSWTSLVRRHRLVIGLSGLYLLLIWMNGFLPRSLEREAIPLVQRLMTQVKALIHYLQTLVMPVALSPEPPFLLSTSASLVVLCALALLASLVVVVIALNRQRFRGPMAFALWMICCLAPAGLAPLNVLVNDRRLYLPMAGVAIAVAAFGPLLRRGRWTHGMVVGSLVLLVLLALLSLQRSQIWADDLQLWQDAVTTGPMMPRAQLYLGDAHLRALETGDTAHRASARRAYEQVLALKPRQQMLSMQAGNGLAWLDLSEGRLSEALLRLEAIVADSPGYCDAWVNLGSAHYQAGLQGQSGALEKALHAYDRALGLRPGRWEAHLNRGAVLQVTGRLDEAEEAYRHAIRLMPTQSGAAMNLGGLFMLRARLATDLNQRIRHWQQARGAYQQAALLGNPVAVRAIQATQDSMASNRGGAR